MKIQTESAARSVDQDDTFSTPSRLVNLHVHEADLLKPAPVPEQLEPATLPAKLEAPDRQLELEIAADYTAASLDATMANLPARVEAPDDLSAAIYAAKQPNSIDQIAATASEAIAAIRSTTDPEGVAEQIASLKEFAANIKKNPAVPEVVELADTIDKFISVAEKSTMVRAEKEKRVRAAAAKSIKEKAEAKVKAEAKAKKAAASTAPRIIIKSESKEPVKPVKSKISPFKKSSKTAARPTATTTRPATTKKATRIAVSTKKSSAVNDDSALRAALKSVEGIEEEKAPARRKHRKGNAGRLALAFGCAAACVAGIVYLVGSNIPDVSIRVAAMQTGIDASYPSYIPRDYSLKGISSENGKIALSFEGPEGAKFTLTEEKCAWDSIALQRNYVEPTWQSDYTAVHEQGIMIYIHDSSAAWVNGGVLHKIDSVAGTLTKKQLKNIVTSM